MNRVVWSKTAPAVFVSNCAHVDVSVDELYSWNNMTVGLEPLDDDWYDEEID